MKTFLGRFACGFAGFLLLELATRPPRPPMSDRAAAAVLDLVFLDAELRAPVLVPPLPVATPRSHCLCLACQRDGGFWPGPVNRSSAESGAARAEA